VASRSLAPRRRFATREVGRSLAPPLIALGLAVVCATALVLSIQIGIALLLALLFVPLALLRLPLALSTWVFLLFFARISTLGGVTNRILLFVAICWIGLLLGRRASLRETFAGSQAVVALALVFISWLLFSLLWAPVAGAAERPIKELLYSSLGFLLVFGAVKTRRDLRWLTIAFVAGAALTVAWGATKGGLGLSAGAAGSEINDLEGRFQAGAGDPNYLAAVLVPAAVLAGGLTFRRGLARRTLLALATLTIAVGIAATQSRGGLIAASGCALVALAIWKGRRGTVAIVILLVLAGVGVYFLNDPSALQRVQESNHGSGRLDIWTVAWRVVQDHPIFGVGLAQFPQVSPHYVLAPGLLEYANLIIEKHIVVHNLYLQLWAEDGIVGLLLFLALVVASLRRGWRAVRQFEALGDRELATAARTVLIALIGMLIASFFLSNLEAGQLWVLLALGPVLARLATQQARAVAPLHSPGLEPIAPPAPLRPRGRLVPG
jgi:O-antigen ligase